jgi:xylulokinase
MGIYLGIDISKSSSMALNSGGRILARSERAHGVSRPESGWGEHHAEGVWWSDPVVIACDLIDQVGTKGIEVMGISGIGSCVLLADEAGTPLRSAARLSSGPTTYIVRHL